MSPENHPETHLPGTVSASLEARLAPYSSHPQRQGAAAPAAALDPIQAAQTAHAAPRDERRLRLGLINDLKLLFAALGAGNSVVPLGDNRRAARLLAEYAGTLASKH
jgi:hypothetical protein